MKKTFCVLLITLGILLETYFYAFRFLADGLPIVVAVALGLTLEILLALVVYKSKTAKAYVLIAVVITGYAVVQTSAGQTFALLSHTVSAGASTATSTADFTLDECKKTIARLSAEADTINSQLRSLRSAEARAAYAATIARATRRLDEISRERARNMDLLLKTSSTEVTAVKTGEERKSIYNFYASMPQWKGDDWLKFLFHFVLSVIIAITAPIGIIAYGGKQAAPSVSFSRQQIEMFVAAAWYKVRNNTGMNILSEIQYNELLQRRGHPVEAGVYFSLSNKCIQLGLINTGGVALEKDHQKVIKILSGETELAVDKWKIILQNILKAVRRDSEKV